MASRHVFRLVQRRFSSGGKVLSEEEKADFIKKLEQGELVVFSREQTAFIIEQTAFMKAQQKEIRSLVEKLNAEYEKLIAEYEKRIAARELIKNHESSLKRWAPVAGSITGLGAFGWYIKTSDKKTKEFE